MKAWIALCGVFFLLAVLLPTQAQTQRQTLTIGFWGDPASPAAQGLNLALEQSNLEVIGSGGNFPYYLNALYSTDPSELTDTVAVLALPEVENRLPTTWEMPVFLLSPDAPLTLPNIQATLWRGMTSQAQLDEMRFDFLIKQSAPQRVMLVGAGVPLRNMAARLQATPGVAVQLLDSTLLTAADFQSLLAFNPQVLFYGGEPISAAGLATALSESGWTGYFVYDHLADLLALDNLVFPSGVYFVQAAFWINSSPDALSQAFVSAYQEKYDLLPTAEALAAYDLGWAIRLLIGRHGADGILEGLPTTPVIRTTSGALNPAAYGNRELFRSGVVYTWLDFDQTLLLGRYDAGAIVTDTLVASFATPTPIPSATPSYATFTVTANSVNVRAGPADNYQVIGELTLNQSVPLVGELRGGGWYLVQAPFGLGWVLARFGAVFSPNAAPLARVDAPPPPTGLPTATIPVITATPGTVAFNPVVPPPTTNSGFELGGQVISQDATPRMREIGMTWLKEQVRWEVGETADQAARGAIQTAKSNGMRVLVTSMGWTHELTTVPGYTEAFVAHVREVAALNPDAIEVWNEPNIALEWTAGQISGGNYTRMLQLAYQAIKSVNPNIMVISAAPAPTGFFRGCAPQGCDDDVFIRQMAEAGAANYLDCVGVHFNESSVSPTQRTGDPRGSHHSYYLPAIIDLYSSVFPGKPLCFTEIGYLTGEDLGGLPSGFEWANSISLAQHAQWLGEAVDVARNAGNVRMLVIWNVNFTQTNPLPWAGWAIFRLNGSCPACDTLRRAMGR